jgi:hypothetical protein
VASWSASGMRKRIISPTTSRQSPVRTKRHVTAGSASCAIFGIRFASHHRERQPVDALFVRPDQAVEQLAVPGQDGLDDCCFIGLVRLCHPPKPLLHTSCTVHRDL